MLPHPPPAGAGRRPVLGDAAGTYRAGPRRLRTHHRRPLPWRLTQAGVLAVLTVAAVIISPLQGLTLLVAVLVVVGLPQALVGLLERRSTTTLQEDGVVVYDGLLRPRTHRWEDVSTVVVEGRYADRSLLRLRDWNEVPLAHVPVEVAQQLRDQLDPSSSRPPRRLAVSDPTPAGGPRPPADLDLEGPFRRGPRRPRPAPGVPAAPPDAPRGTP